MLSNSGQPFRSSARFAARCLSWFALFALLMFARAATADNMCAPALVGVFGLTGPPDFANQPEVVATNNDLAVPAGFGQQLDDPRWNGSWRQDFAGGGATEAGMRALQDGNVLYLSFLVYTDPTATLTAGGDKVFVGFSDGTKADLAQIVITAGEPLRNSPSISGSTWFKTINGGTIWTIGAGPLGWVETGKIRAWSGDGTHAWGPAGGPGTGVTGVRWAINMRIDLALVGAHLGLGGALPRPFKFFSEISIATPSGPATYDWPLGTALDLSTGVPTFLITNWGNATADLTTCSGTSVTWDHIGTMPISSGIPSTTVYYPPKTNPNDFVAVLTDTIPISHTVQARFRLANWGSQIGVGGDWRDILPPSGGNPGTVLNGTPNPNDQIVWHCVNTGAGDPCPTLASGQPKDQCLLVELSQAPAAVGVTFKQDSARRNMDFVNASKFERSAEISIKGLAPLPGSGGQRDVYLYVKAANMPKDVTAAPPGGSAAGQTDQGRPGATAMVAGQDGRSDKQPKLPPTTYERLSTSYPTYEVHVYHTTGKTRQEGGKTVTVLEPQVPFGYFVQHQGDLAGWEHSLVGEGVTLELVAPNFYHVKVPDNGAVNVHTKIVACQNHFFGLFRCCCSLGRAQRGGADGWFAAFGLGLLFAMRVRRRRRGDS